MLKHSRFCRAAAALALTLGGSFLPGLASAQTNWTGATNDWTDGANWSTLSVPGAGDDVVFGTPIPGSGAAIALGAGSLANSLWIQDNYTFNTNDLTLTSGDIRVNLGQQLTLNSQLSGAAGLTLLGGGVLRLTNPLNDFTGTTDILGGMLVITNPAQLGGALNTNAINVTAGNSVPSNTNTIGFTGGGLMLDGSGGSINLVRNLNLEGLGHFGNRSGALVSVGNNTLSGVVATSVSTQSPITNRQTRLLQSNGTLTISGTFDVGSATSGVQVTTLGGNNTAGAGGNFSLSGGTLTGLGYVEKTGAGTLFWNPNDASAFGGRLRVSAGATGGQSSVRVNSNLDGLGNPIFGTANLGGNAMPIDLNGGVLEIRNDSSLNFARNVYQRANSTTFVGPAEGGIGVNQTMTFAAYHTTQNLTHTFNSRNGYGMTFTGNWTQNASNDNNTITNNMGGTLTFSGTAWNNGDSNDRTLVVGGNGNTVITGSINTSGGTKNLTKSGSGLLVLNGTGTALNGNVNISGGAVAIRDFRSVNNNTATIAIGSGSTAGALIVGTSAAVGSAANLTTSKAISLSGSTAAASIYANQTGANPVVLNGTFSAGTSAKTLTFGGTNTADNIISAAITDAALPANVSVTKIGSGTWVLGGANTYSGVTTIQAGTLKLRANAAASTVISDTGGVTFSGNTTTGTAGGTLEFRGFLDNATTESFGPLTPTAGPATVRLLGNGTGSASATFSSLGATAAGTSLNFDTASSGGGTITLTGVADTTATTLPGTANFTGRLYMNGADFAIATGGVLSAPTYGGAGNFREASSALIGSVHNKLTGSFTNAAATVSSLLTNSQTLSLSGNLIVSTGGILQSGGTATIQSNSTAARTITGAVAATNIAFRVNGGSDVLNIGSSTNPVNVASATTGGITKNGAGRLVFFGTNAQTGATNINEGTVELNGSIARLSSATAQALAVRQGAALEFNTGVAFVAQPSVSSLDGAGTIRNIGSTDVTFTQTAAGTWNGSFGQTGSGVLNVTKAGTTGAPIWSGLSSYTGVTTIVGTTGSVTVDFLANIGSDSGIGRGVATNDATNAASLVFAATGATPGGLIYRGDSIEGALTLGSRSVSTNRLFTVTGSGLTLGSSQTTNLNQAVVWSNTGTIVHGGTPQDRNFIFTGTSQGDNTFVPQITDPTGFATTVTKTGTGVWHLRAADNTYSGPTVITQGILGATNGDGLSLNSNLQFNGGTLYSQGTFTRNIGTAAGQMQFLAPAANTAQFSGGFVGGDSKLTVNWSGTPVWGGGAGFLDTRNGLLFNGSQARAQGATGSNALSEVEVAGNFSLGSASAAGGSGLSFTLANNSATVTGLASTAGFTVGQSFTGTNVPSGAYIVSIDSATQITLSANTASSGASGTFTDGSFIANNLRAIRVDDNANTGADFATISGIISAGDSTSGIRKLGTGALKLTGANTYEGETNVNQGTLAVNSLGLSGTAGTSSVGAVTVAAFTNANAVTLGNGGTGAGILQYIGGGETSNRLIRLNTTTGTTQIHADGTGSLILSGVTNDMVAGAKTLALRGTSVYTNFITNQLSDNGGALSITVDGSTAWVLNNPLNNYTGNTTASGGLLGIGDNAALGAGTLVNNNGNVFAYGGDRSIANAVTLSTNAANGWQGDYNLTFTGTVNFAATTTNITTNNSIVSGKALTFNGMTNTGMTANRSWTLNGPGHTIINGDFTTSTLFGVPTIINNGMLSLGGTGASNFNQNGANIDIDNGALRFIASNAVSSAAGAGGILFSPESTTNDTARLEMNGTNQTFTSFASTGAGIGIIDNNSGTAATLRFGANGGAVDFGSGGGTYSILNTGAGALSVIHSGNAPGSIAAGVTLNHQGLTASEGGGIFTISSAVTATTGLSVTNASSLRLQGGITNQNLITSLTVDAGSTLDLLDGAGTVFTNLSALNLGVGGTGTVNLNLNVGSGNTDTLQLLSGAAGLGNTITFNMTDTGLASNTTYTLLNLTGGGLNAFGFANLIQGSTPTGFDSMSWFVDDNVVQLTTGNLITGSLYWRGATDTTWQGSLDNWSLNKDGTGVPTSLPGAGTDVIFQWDAPTNAAVTTTLEQNFKINSLNFEASTTPANTPTSVTINPGAVSTNRVEIAPQVATDGIEILAGGPSVVTIAAPVRLGAPQTWTVADSGSLLTLGQLLGGADVTVAGPGRVVLGTAAASTFNTGANAGTDITITGGALETTIVSALGSLSDGNLADVVLSGGSFYYNNATSGTVANPISLNGGTLSAAGNAQTYSGAVAVDAASFVNMRDSNSATLTTTSRAITLSGVVSGTQGITIDSINTATANNQITGNLQFYNGNSTWTGPLNMTRGTAIFSSLGNSGTPIPFFGYNGIINFNQFGRVIQRGINGNVVNRTAAINFAASAYGEFLVDNISATLLDNVTVNQNGAVNLNAGSVARFNLEDAFSELNLNGGIALTGDASISFNGAAATQALSINTVGISGTGNLALNDDAGAWGQTNDIIAINAASTFVGNVSFTEGTLVLGNKDALGPAGSNTLTMLGGTLQANTDLSGANAVANPVNQNNSYTVSGSNNITLSGLYNATGANANRTLTNNLTAGSTLLISGGVNLGATGTTAARTWTVTGTGSTEITGAIINNTAFAHVLVKDGAGTMVLSNTAGNAGGTTGNTYTGGTVINQGILRSGASNVLPNTGTITVRSNVVGNPVATLDLNNFSDTIAALTFGGSGGLATSVNSVTTGTGTLTIGGNLTVTTTGEFATPATFSGNLSVGGANRNFVIGNSTGTDVDFQVDAVISSVGAFGVTKSGAGVMLYNQANTYTGGTVINNGEIRYGVNSAINSASAVTLNPNGAAFTSLLNLNGFNGTVASLTFGGAGQTADSVATVQTGAGTLTLNGGVTLNATGDFTTSRLITGNLNLGASNRTFNIANSTSSLAELNVQALVSSTGGGITKTGDGTLLLSNAGNSYTGPTTINAGILAQGVAGAIPSGSSVTVSATGTSAALALNDLNLTIASLNFGGSTTTSASTVSNGTGTLTLGGNVTYSATNNPATAEILGGTLNLGGSDRTFTVGDSTTQVVDLRVTSAITNGAVTKAGLGTLEFTGTNTYAGTTTINAGTLLINGDNSGATGSIIIADGAILGGSGTVGGATTIVGIHSPGNSPGIQTFNAGLEYNGANTSFVWELYSSTATPGDRGNATIGWDGVNVTGGDLNFISPTTMSLVFNGTTGSGSTVNWADALWTSNQQWLVYQITGGGSVMNLGNFSIFTTDWKDSAGNDFSAYGGSASNFFLTQELDGNIYLNFNAIPEPSRALLVLIGALGMTLRRRRKTV